MARTKDRYQVIECKSELKETFRAGIYIRLSCERTEAWREKSSSIKAQEIICKDYAKSKKINVVHSYIDYEYSGANFNRPGYIQMMDDIRNQNINCIIVRDLSRLGREYLEMGRLIDKVFPFLGVRFISVIDNLDSFYGMDNNKSFEVVVKNIVNDMYVKDISDKVKSTKINQAKNGWFLGAFAPYGYKIEKTKTSRTLYIDEEVKDVVYKIFEMALQGFTHKQISEYLNEMKYSSPAEYHKTGKKFRNGEDRQWTNGSIASILRNEKYYGTLVQGKQCKDAQKKDWISVENTHPAYISKETFEKIQEIKQENLKNSAFNSTIKRGINHNIKKDPVNRYKDIIYRMDSDEKLRRHIIHSTPLPDGSFRNHYYVFRDVRYQGIKRNPEKNIHIKESDIDNIVYDIISKTVQTLGKQEDVIVIIDDELEKIESMWNKEKDRLQKKKQREASYIQRNYENYVLGNLDGENFLDMKTKSKLRIQLIEQELAIIDKKNRERLDKVSNIKSWIISLYTAKSSNPKLPLELINSLIEKVEVSPEKEVRVTMKYNINDLEGIYNE